MTTPDRPTSPDPSRGDSEPGSSPAPGPPSDGSSSKVRHTPPTFGSAVGDSDATGAVPVAERDGPTPAGSKIRALEPRRRHEEQWNRTPNTTGTGAIHVKTFHCKLTDDALRYLDQTINEWLDAHPQYEVKFVNTSVGVLTGKLKEPHLICQVWV